MDVFTVALKDGTAADQAPGHRDRAVGGVTRELLDAVGELGGPVAIDPTPQGRRLRSRDRMARGRHGY